MKNFFWAALWLTAGTLGAQDASVTGPASLPQTSTAEATPGSAGSTTPAPSPVIIKKWVMATVPWDGWFKNNAMVTDKTDYVHFFWNAQDFKENFEVKDKKLRLGEAALQLIAKLYPADAKADLVKVDIVYVLERDAYGQPKWDSLQQVAHFEFSKSKTLKIAKSKKEPALPALQKAFDQYVIY